MVQRGSILLRAGEVHAGQGSFVLFGASSRKKQSEPDPPYEKLVAENAARAHIGNPAPRPPTWLNFAPRLGLARLSTPARAGEVFSVE